MPIGNKKSRNAKRQRTAGAAVGTNWFSAVTLSIHKETNDTALVPPCTESFEEVPIHLNPKPNGEPQAVNKAKGDVG